MADGKGVRFKWTFSPASFYFQGLSFGSSTWRKIFRPLKLPNAWAHLLMSSHSSFLMLCSFPQSKERKNPKARNERPTRSKSRLRLIVAWHICLRRGREQEKHKPSRRVS